MPRSRRPEIAGLREVVARIVETRSTASRISPSWVATEAMYLLDGDRISPVLVYLGCHLQLRQIAREVLRGRYEPDGQGDDDAQDELWPDLQRRYPTAKSARDDDPEYVLLEDLTETDIGYNVARLRGEADAKQKHADALEAYGASRPPTKRRA